MVEVFKTNIRTKKKSEMLLLILCEVFPSHKINFDLDDCDKILRIAGGEISTHQVIFLLQQYGYHAEVLD